MGHIYTKKLFIAYLKLKFNNICIYKTYLE